MIEMIQSGLLSSISVMSERVTSEQSSQLEKIRELYQEKDLSLGLHLEITNTDGDAVFERQWDQFENLLGLTPNYVDVHKGHFNNITFDTVAKFCLSRSVYFRKYNETTIFVSSPAQSFTATYQDLDIINKWIGNFDRDLTYELIFHIGKFDPDCKSSLNQEREIDVEKLRRVHQLLAEKRISVVSYKSLTARVI